MAARDPPAAVELCKGINGLDKVVLRGLSGSSAEVYLHGAQVTSWRVCEEEQLFVIQKAGEPIYGGIPISFVHVCENGFAGTRIWSIDSNPPPPPRNPLVKSYIDMILKPSEHRYEVRLRILLGLDGVLVFSSSVKNTDDNSSVEEALKFQFGYETYFSVANTWKVHVGAAGLDTSRPIIFKPEMKQVYLDTRERIFLLDVQRNRMLSMRRKALPDAVVWNSREKKAKEMTDEDCSKMVCVQAAALENPTLKPGEVWKGKLVLQLLLQ